MLVKSLFAAALAGASAFSFSNELENEKLSPAQRVVKLLREMKSQLEAEATKDQEIATKLECWCKTNTAEKEAAIASADARSEELAALINESAAKKAKMDVTIKQAKKELAQLRSALEKATSIREKETAEFRATHSEMVKTVTNLDNAIAVLSKHQAGLLQMTPEVKQAVSAVIHSASEKHQELFGTKPEAKKAEKAAFLQSASENKEQAVFLQAVAGSYRPVLSEHSAARLISSFVETSAAPHLGNYQSQSGSIFGILTSMLDNFKASMGDALKQEKAAQAAYVELKAASESQIAATADALAQAKADFAEASKTLADSKEELEKTREVRAADVEFLRNLKLQCNDIDAQWAARQQERADETAAVSEAISVLMDDDNRELLAKTVSFVQSGMESKEERRSRAAAVLRAASRKSPSWDDLSFRWQGERKPVMKDIAPKQDLAVIAAKVQLDAFTKVKQAMDEMTAQIKAQMATDVKHRDFCTAEFSQNDKNNVKKTHESEDLTAKIEDLAQQITGLTEEIANANTAIGSARKEIKKAGEDREAENALFQTEVQEQRATQVVLAKALAKLNQYYAKKAAFLQLQNGQKQTPPVAFTPYNKNAGSSPVLALIGKIVEDSKAIESEAMKDEQTAQANYETFVADSNSSIKALQDEIASNSEAKANKEGDRVNTESAKADATNELEMLAAYKADLHQSCDFTTANFEVRQQAMTDEIEAIAEAKAILSGAK